MVRAEPPLRAKLGRALLRAIDLVSRFVALWCGGALLGVLMLLIIVDVTGRYLFSSPLYGSLDLSITILVLVVAASLAYGGRTGAHVTADIFTTLVSARIEWLTGLFVKFFAAAVTALWCWRLFVTGRTAARLGESTLLLNIPFEPIYQALGAGVGLFAVVLLIEGVVLALTGHVPQLVDESRVAMDVRTGGEDAP
jgi:TRAP-type C4-dicarboxylate transport system permease small subunit